MLTTLYEKEGQALTLKKTGEGHRKDYYDIIIFLYFNKQYVK